MIYYADSSFLVSCYIVDANTAAGESVFVACRHAFSLYGIA